VSDKTTRFDDVATVMTHIRSGFSPLIGSNIRYNEFCPDSGFLHSFISSDEVFQMNHVVNGQMVPVGGGDPIPLRSELLSIGRRDSCDICLKFQNISGMHCELSWRKGFWFVRDLGSTNGIKVNGTRVMQKPLRPGDELAIGLRRYTLQYSLAASAEAALEDILTEAEDISVPLMEKAGLSKPRRNRDDD